MILDQQILFYLLISTKMDLGGILIKKRIKLFMYKRMWTKTILALVERHNISVVMALKPLCNSTRKTTDIDLEATFYYLWERY